MGYHTSYSLSIINGDPEIISELRTVNGDAAEALQENGDSEEPVTWYNCEKDLRAFSKLHPEIIFKLHGDGEESGDIWNEYYQNGKKQSCPGKITYEDFDPLKLE